MATTTSFWPILLLCYLVINTNICDATSSSVTNTLKPTEEVEGVCNKTSNYSFCVDSLYSDGRTADADAYTLSFIAVGLAYNNASDTQALISQLLKQHNSKEQKLRLERCSRDYKKAADAFAMAFNDLNSETFYYLDEYAAKASKAAKDCESAFRGVPSRPLSLRNRDIVGLSEIVAIVGKLFTGGN